MSGKGSTRRPKQITEAELDARWASTFGHPVKRRAVTIGGVDYLEVEELRPNGVSITRWPVEWMRAGA